MKILSNTELNKYNSINGFPEEDSEVQQILNLPLIFLIHLLKYLKFTNLKNYFINLI